MNIMETLHQLAQMRVCQCDRMGYPACTIHDRLKSCLNPNPCVPHSLLACHSHDLPPDPKHPPTPSRRPIHTERYIDIRNYVCQTSEKQTEPQGNQKPKRYTWTPDYPIPNNADYHLTISVATRNFWLPPWLRPTSKRQVTQRRGGMLACQLRVVYLTSPFMIATKKSVGRFVVCTSPRDLVQQNVQMRRHRSPSMGYPSLLLSAWPRGSHLDGVLALLIV